MASRMTGMTEVNAQNGYYCGMTVNGRIVPWIIATALTGLISASAIAQNSAWPDGLYYTIEEFSDRTPRSRGDFKLVESKERPGEFIFLFEHGQSAGWLDPYRTLFVVHQDVLYFSGKKIHRGEGFLRCLTKGNFIVYNLNTTNKYNEWFEFEPDPTDSIQPTINAGPVFKLYVHSLRTGNSRLLTRAYVEARLAEHPDLLEKFNGDCLGFDAAPDDLMIRYMQLLNERVPVK
jgi:hypothetical protein